MPTGGKRKLNRYALCPDGRTVLLNLTRGMVALIDAVDLPRVLTRGWCVQALPGGRFYVKGWNRERRQIEYLHRFLLNAPAGQHIDHQNGNGLDNRRVNLRFATPSQNCANQHVRRTRTKSSRFKGVSWRAYYQRWCAEVHCEGRRYTRSFLNEEDAARWYNATAREVFGEFALLNAVDA